MFPDISCDDIFRLETARLWLRWLKASDAPAVQAICSMPDVALLTASIPHPYPIGEAERFILQARAATASGQAIILALTLKAKSRAFVGIVSIQASDGNEAELGYFVAPGQTGLGYASEAAATLVDVVFNLTEIRAVVATTQENNDASRRVLEKCGFAFAGHVTKDMPARGPRQPCNLWRLERQHRSRTLRRRLPGMSTQPAAGAPRSDATTPRLPPTDAV